MMLHLTVGTAIAFSSYCVLLPFQFVFFCLSAVSV
jgi:hypothetical protein